jgi:hypothetical protein
MYNRIARDNQYILDLKRFVETQYDLQVLNISFARRGFFGETWKIDAQSHAYFAKIDFSGHNLIYQNSLPVVEYLSTMGVDFISKIVKTSDGKLAASFRDGVFCLFEWVDGENTEDYDIKRLFEKLAVIYKIPGNGIIIQKESFDTSCIDCFYRNLKKLQLAVDKASLAFLQILTEREKMINQRADKLSDFSLMCKGDSSHFCITHGDAGGNVIISGGSFIIVDWDQPLLAPPERDAWFLMADAGNMRSIQSILDNNDINYQLRNERLAFYAYYSFFYYLQEYFTCFFEAGEDVRNELLDNVAAFFDGWIAKPIRAADGIPCCR